MAKKIETANEAPLIVGVDDGFACTDIVVMEGGKVVSTAVINSRAINKEINTVSFGSVATTLPVFETDGEIWTVDDSAQSQSAPNETYPLSAMNRAIVHQALRVAGLAGRNVHIATGLPLQDFYIGAQPNLNFIEKKKASLLKPVKALDGQPLANIVAHNVFPEGLAAWVDYAVEGGKLRADPNETVGVIDVGGRTTDCAVVMPGRRIDHARCGSAIAGANDIVTAVTLSVMRDSNRKVDEAIIAKAIRAGVYKVNIAGVPFDFTHHVEAAKSTVLAMVKNEADRRFGEASSIDRIILVGGGAYLFKEGLKALYPNQLFVPEQPEFANARGFAKYLSI